MNTLQITEKRQDKLSVAVTPNNLDGKLGDLPDPLPDTSRLQYVYYWIAGQQARQTCFTQS